MRRLLHGQESNLEPMKLSKVVVGFTILSTAAAALGLSSSSQLELMMASIFQGKESTGNNYPGTSPFTHRCLCITEERP